MQKFQRKWPAKDFVDRWFLQTNYPTLMVSLKYDSIKQSQYLEVIQNRHIWYVPLKCALGQTLADTQLSYKTFDVEARSSNFNKFKLFSSFFIYFKI